MMENAPLALVPDRTGLDQLLIDDKNKPTEHRAMQQQAVLAFGRRTNAQPPLPVLLQDAVTLACEVLHTPLGGIGEVHGDALALTVAPPGDGDRATAAREHHCPLGDGRSMAAFAMKSGNVTVTGDLRRETRFADDFLLARNVVGALTAPLHVNGKPFGALGVYTHAPRQFSLDEVAFAETIAHLLGTSVARIKAEEQLEQAREMKSSLLGMVDSMVMTLDMEGRIVDMNRACEELTKHRLDDLRNQPFWQAMVAPDDADLVKIIFESSRGSQIPSEFEGEVLAGDGSRRQVSWSLKVLATGQVQTILVTGRDQTAQAEIKAELLRAKMLAEETNSTLGQLTARLGKPRNATAAPPASQERDEVSEAPSGSRTPVPEHCALAGERPTPQPAAGVSLPAGHCPHGRPPASPAAQFFRRGVLGHFRLRILVLHGPVAQVRDLCGGDGPFARPDPLRRPGDARRPHDGEQGHAVPGGLRLHQPHPSAENAGMTALQAPPPSAATALDRHRPILMQSSFRHPPAGRSR